MPQRKTLPTEDQNNAITECCAKHNVSPTVAGRIAWARLLAKKPTPQEIRKATIPQGNPETLRQFQRE